MTSRFCELLSGTCADDLSHEHCMNRSAVSYLNHFLANDTEQHSSFDTDNRDHTHLGMGRRMGLPRRALSPHSTTAECSMHELVPG